MAHRSIVVGVSLSLLLGCGKNEGDDPIPGLGTEVCDVQAVLAVNNCTSCHDATPGTEGANLDLVSPGLEERLLNQPSVNGSCASELLIDGANPDASLFLRVIAPDRYAGHGSDSCNAPSMPLGSAELMPQEHVDCLDAWVRNVAVEGPEEPKPFDPAPIETVVSKAKFLVHGGAVTDEELAAAKNEDGSLNREGLRGLIDTWMWQSPGGLTDEFSDKLRMLFSLALQQERPTGSATFQYQAQLGFRLKNTDTNPAPVDGDFADKQAIADTMPHMFPVTARDIVADERDFREVVTTRRLRVTTAILAALVHTDTDVPRDKFGRLAEDSKFGRFYYLTEPDYTDWRYINIEQATGSNPPDVSYENTADFAATLRDIPDDGSVRLWAPRVGFFNTFVFYDWWETNMDNQYRVTISQTLVGALDLIFEAGDQTPPPSLVGLDDEHSEEGSSCYGCHSLLDPMRGVFENYYGIDYRSKGAPVGEPSTFGFHGHTMDPVSTMDDLAEAIATHPRFAAAWTQKLCMWANSQRCLETDPEFIRVAEVFANGYDLDSPDDDFRLTTLVRELISSTLVTGSEPSEMHDRIEFIVSPTRAQHFCVGSRARLRQACDMRTVEDGLAPDECTTPQADCTSSIASLELALGSDSSARGVREFTTPSDADPMQSIAVREACRSIAKDVSGDSRAFPRGGDPAANVARMVQTVMGLPPSHPRYATAYDTLLRTYRILRASGECPNGQSPIEANADVPTDGEFVCGAGLNGSEAIQQLYVIACSSPDHAGIGF